MKIKSMNHKLLKTLLIGLTLCSLFSMSSMVTQDEQSAFSKEVQKLIDSGISKDDIKDYLRSHGYANDIVGGTQALKEAEASGYFNNSNSSTPATTTTATPAPSATPTPTPKHEHKYSVKLTKDPTCYEEGTLTYTCDCGDTYEEPVAQLEHQYTDTVTKEPTCTTEGERTYKCSLCGDTYTEVIEAKGHMDGQFIITKEPTCTEPGEKTVYCKVCNEEIRTESIDPTGHENTDTRLTPSGLFSAGKEEIYCLKCMKVLETRVIPVPVWHYVVFGIGVTIILIILIAVWIGRIAHKK